MSLSKICKTINAEVIHGVPLLKQNTNIQYSKCPAGKQIKTSHKTGDHIRTNRVEFFHLDLMGPIQVESHGGKKHVLLVLDDYSRFTWV